MGKYLIVGGVAGGMSTAARLRRLDEKSEIIVFEKGEYISYANCGLPYYIGETIKEKEKLLVQTPKSINRRFNIDVRTLNEVIKIDRKEKKVIVKDISKNTIYEEKYDKLILSPGAEPVIPNIPGINNPKIFTLRNIPDTEKIKKFIDENKPKRALIIGAGFIGMEMAENLHQRGIFVTIVEMMNQVMNVVDFEIAAMVHQHLKSKNIEFYLEDAVTGFEDSQNKLKVILKSGKELFVDFVILSIGVKPDIKLALDCGLEIGQRKGILVNEFLQTSDPDIYAVGDAIEIINPIINKRTIIPLAGPANKQGRIIADNIVFGNTKKYRGTIGTSIAKVFDLTVAVTGATEKLLKAENIPYNSTIIHSYSHATYYPSSTMLTLKLLFSPIDGKIYGAQSVGYEGVDKRIDLISAILLKNGTIYDLQEIEHSYAPPYSSAKDPVNMIGFVAENILTGKVKSITWDELDKLDKNDIFLLDVRTQEEYKSGTIEGAYLIPVDNIRNRLNEIPKDKKIIVFCRVGLRGYIAARILMQNGFKDVFNLSGGYITYSAVKQKQDNPNIFDESFDTGLVMHSYTSQINKDNKTIKIDACGLQCPGPILKVKNEIDKINFGDKLEIIATDPGFYNDVSSWARVTGNKIVSLNIEKGIVHAIIEKSKIEQVTKQNNISNDKTIIVFDGDLDKAIASFIIANGALSMGRKVTMFFTFWGLNIIRKTKKVKGLKKNFIEKMFEMMLPRGTKKLGLSRMNMFGLGPIMIKYIMKKKKVDTLETLINTAIQNKVRLVACQMSMDLMGIKKEELIDGVEIGGVATYLEAAESANTNLFI